MNSDRFKAYVGLLLVLLVFFAITIYTSWRVPLSVGPDEVAHFMFARFLKKEGYLPLTQKDREAAGFKSDQTPLNAALVAITYLGGDLNAPPYVKLTHSVPRRHLVLDGLVDPTGRAFNIVNTEDPVAGEFLFWRFGRLVSTVVSGLSLIIIYAIALKTFEDLPQKNLWALAAVMSLAFIPTFVFISGVFSYENLLGLWLSLYLLTAIYVIKGKERGWLYLLAGLFIGLAIATKLSALPAPLSLVLLILWASFQRGWSKHKCLNRLSLGMLGVLLGVGWWFALIEFKLNKVNELGWVAGLLHPLASDEASSKVVNILATRKLASIETTSLANLLDWLRKIFWTFWTLQGKGQTVVISILFVISILILTGLIKIWWRRPESRAWLTLLCIQIILFFFLPLVRFLTTGLKSVAGQGQHVMFPALGAFAILITWGLGAWFPARLGRQWLGGMLLGLGLLGWSVSHAIYLYPSPRPVPVRTAPPVMPPSASEIELDFGPMVLKGYELKGLMENAVCCDSSHLALGVNLYWVAQEFAQEDYLTTVSLIDSQGQAQSSWVGHGADGRYPTRAWEPGDIIRDELYLPVVGLKPGTYKIQLEVEGSQFPLVVQPGTTFTLTTVSLSNNLPRSDAPLVTDQNPSFELWQAGQVVDSLPEFQERSTIQITTAPDVSLSLIGPEQIARQPVKIAGRTNVFIVDPLWSKGDYQLHAISGPESDWQSAPLLTIVGNSRQTEIPPSQIAVKANFANELMLLGYNLPKRQLRAGEPVSITLNWQALQTAPTDFIMFVRLRDRAGKVWGGYDRWPQGYYSPMMWAAGEVVEDSFSVPISAEAPGGLYYLDVGFYFLVGESPVSLPLVQDGQLSDVTNVTIGPFKIGDMSLAGVTSELPKPENMIDQPFGDRPNLTLLGYDLEKQVNESSPNLKVTLYWRVETPLSIDYTTFVHLRNKVGEIVAQKDQPPLNGQYPTSVWSPDEIITDEIVVPLPPSLPVDDYSLVVGLYDLHTGVRLTVPGHPDDSLTLPVSATRAFLRSGR